MKYLFTTLVTGAKAGRELVSAKDEIRAYAERSKAEQSVLSGEESETHERQTEHELHKRVLNLEDAMRAMLADGARDAAFYRELVDGWDPTHVVLMPWFMRHRPEARAVWREFTQIGVLGGITRSYASCFLPQPTSEELADAWQLTDVGEGYARAFMTAFFDGLEYLNVIDGTIIVTARCLGGVRSDEEYE